MPKTKKRSCRISYSRQKNYYLPSTSSSNCTEGYSFLNKITHNNANFVSQFCCFFSFTFSLDFSLYKQSICSEISKPFKLFVEICHSALDGLSIVLDQEPFLLVWF